MFGVLLFLGVLLFFSASSTIAVSSGIPSIKVDGGDVLIQVEEQRDVYVQYNSKTQGVVRVVSLGDIEAHATNSCDAKIALLKQSYDTQIQDMKTTYDQKFRDMEKLIQSILTVTAANVSVALENRIAANEVAITGLISDDDKIKANISDFKSRIGTLELLPPLVVQANANISTLGTQIKILNLTKADISMTDSLQLCCSSLGSNLTLVTNMMKSNFSGVTSQLSTLANSTQYLSSALSNGGLATRVPVDAFTTCDSFFKGGLRYSTNSTKLEVCNGNDWVPTSLDPLGSFKNPATFCKDIFTGGFSKGNGLYYFKNPANPLGDPVLKYCSMSSSPQVSLGGDGSSAALAGTSCQFLLANFNIMTSVRYVVMNESNAESLSYVARVLCVVNSTASTASIGSYDGSDSKLPASSCAVLKTWFAAPSGVYFIGNAQYLCDLSNSSSGVLLGGDGSSIALASTNCDTIRQHNVASKVAPVSAVYYIGLNASSGPYQVYCFLNATYSLNLGGDGSSLQKASVSCANIKARFNQASGTYYIDPDQSADNGANANLHFCSMATATDLGGDGQSQTNAAPSCLHLYTYFNEKTSAVRWLNPASPFQVYCDQTDSGGWMKILQYDTSYYSTSRGAIGTIGTASTSGVAKLSDANINFLTGERVYRFVSAYSSLRGYVRSTAAYDDLARGQNLFSVAINGAQAASFSGASWNSCSRSYLDTIDGCYGNIANDANRIFSDYSAAQNCYQVCTGNCRCFSCGISCNNHQPIIPFSMWVRQYNNV